MLKDKLLKVINLAVDISEAGEHQVFVRYSPHVSCMDIEVHKGKWNIDNSPILNQSIYYGVDVMPDKKMDRIIDYLNTLLPGEYKVDNDNRVKYLVSRFKSIVNNTVDFVRYTDNAFDINKNEVLEPLEYDDCYVLAGEVWNNHHEF